MTPRETVIVDYEPKYGPGLVRMWRDSFEQAVGVVDPHPIAEQLQYLQQKVVPENRVLVVQDKGSSEVLGFMAATQDQITQLYVHVNHQKEGIGSLLVNLAKQRSSGRLRLFTFQVNKKARRFYERHGFRVIGSGYDKEWQLEDVEYEWTIAEAAT